jgi:hypothetical protein
VEVALRRNAERKGFKVPEHVIQRMAERLEPPERNDWETEHTTVLDSHSLSTSQCLPLVQEAISRQLGRPPLEDPEVKRKQMEDERAKQRAINLSSLFHQLDLLLRKEVGAMLKASPGTEHAAALARVRKLFLEELRQRGVSAYGHNETTPLEQLTALLVKDFRNLCIETKHPQRLDMIAEEKVLQEQWNALGKIISVRPSARVAAIISRSVSRVCGTTTTMVVPATQKRRQRENHVVGSPQ